MASEKSPLLGNETDHSLRYGQSTYGPDVDNQTTYVTVPPIGPDELPPPYTHSPHGAPMISCQVCGFMIDISERRDQHVVKCNSCNEATPIKEAPHGKKYVRCRCNCLLICKASSQRVACPRNHCKTIISLDPTPAAPVIPVVPGMCQVSCAHCRNLFLFNTLNSALARCPHCRKVSSVGQQFPRNRGIIFIVSALIVFACGLAVTLRTYPQVQKYAGLYVAYVGLFITALILFIRAMYYFTMKVSHIQGPV